MEAKCSLKLHQDLQMQSSTFSNYKHHNTAKFLIACTPNGAVCYISPLYVSSISDKAPTNSRIFDYSFVNFLFDEKNGSQIFGGRVSRWLVITPPRSQHVRGGVCVTSRWLKTSSWSCHSAQGASQFEHKVLGTLAKFGELLDSLTARVEGGDSSGLNVVWRPARCRRRWNPAADIGMTGKSTNSWRTTTWWPDEDSADEPSARPLVSDSTATTIRMAFRKPLSVA